MRSSGDRARADPKGPIPVDLGPCIAIAVGAEFSFALLESRLPDADNGGTVNGADLGHPLSKRGPCAK